jgi:hypothetical protein
MLRYGQDYVDAGEEAYDRQFEARRLAGLREAARAMGFSLTAQPATTPAKSG